mgnify:CR=1 FL=1
MGRTENKHAIRSQDRHVRRLRQGCIFRSVASLGRRRQVASRDLRRARRDGKQNLCRLQQARRRSERRSLECIFQVARNVFYTVEIHYWREPTKRFDSNVIIHSQRSGGGMLVWTNAETLVTCKTCLKLLGIASSDNVPYNDSVPLEANPRVRRTKRLAVDDTAPEIDGARQSGLTRGI